MAVDPVVERLMGPGAPFETVPATVSGRTCRVFRSAPNTLADIINAARQHDDAEFCVLGDQRLTYSQAFARVDALAGWLQKNAGIKPGQGVAIAMRNRPEWLIAFMAVTLAGGVCILINSRNPGAIMADAVTLSEAKFILADERRAEVLTSETHVPILSVGQDWDRAIDAGRTRTDVSRDTDDIAVMFFTSGTTGRAKAAALSHRAMVTGTMNTGLAMAAVFARMAAQYGMEPEQLRAQMPQSCSLLVFPLFHVSGCSATFLTALTIGGKLVFMDRWSGSEALDLVEAERITVFGGVPAMHWDVLKALGERERDLSSLVSISCGGQALPRALLDKIHAAFPSAYIGAGYGMTEASGAISQANGEAFLARPEASGSVLPMIDIRIVSPEGKGLPHGQAGEIQVKGATLLTRYHGDPEATKASFDGDWFKTGDVGMLDDQGVLTIVDRLTDMIITGGENVYALEVEKALQTHPDVTQAAVFGVPDERMGEKVVAVASGRASSETLKTHAADRLASYKCPVEIRIVDTMPVNAMAKPDKAALKSLFTEGQA